MEKVTGRQSQCQEQEVKRVEQWCRGGGCGRCAGARPHCQRALNRAWRCCRKASSKAEVSTWKLWRAGAVGCVCVQGTHVCLRMDRGHSFLEIL